MLDGDKGVDDSAESDNSEMFGLVWETTKVDKLMLDGVLEFELSDIGLLLTTAKGRISVEFDQERFRPAEAPILLSSTEKIQQLGFRTEHTLRDIIDDQLDHYLDPSR